MTGFSALPVAESGDDGDVRWAGVSKILGPRWLQLPALTIGLLGVQVLWSVEMSSASPYLIRLGLSKSLTAIAFLAGPLSGLLVQPLIGVIADNSKSRFGRRRPYMLMASTICAASMLLLGFTRDFVSIFTTRGSSSNDTVTIIFAVIALYGLDFSVNAVQAVDRALIVDSVPASLQPDSNSWAARMLGLGTVLGFFVGNIDLTKIFWFFGESEIKVLAVIAALLLLSTQLVTAVCVKEKVLITTSKVQKSFGQEIREIWDNILTLPRIIRQICIIQFLAWLAWFPVLFYTSVYIGDFYKSELPLASDQAEVDSQEDQAGIIGSRALFHFGVVALIANFVLPIFVKAEGDTRSSSTTSGKASLLDKLKIVHLSELWAFSHLLFAACMGATFFVSSVSGASFLITVVGFSWAITQWAPFSLLAEEILGSSSQDESFDDSGSISIRLLDRPGRTSMEPLSEEPELVWDESDERHRLMDDSRTKHLPAQRISDEDGGEVDASFTGSRASSIESARPNANVNGVGVLGNGAARQSRLELHSELVNGEPFYAENEIENLASRRRPGGLQAKSGIIIGIHNLFIVIPQFISTAITSLIFAVFDPNKSGRPGQAPGTNGAPAGLSADDSSSSASFFTRQETAEEASHGANSVAIVFRIGGIAALLAFVLSWRLARELKRGR